MCLEKAGKNALFPVTHRFPRLLLFQALRTNELGNLCLDWAPVFLPLAGESCYTLLQSWTGRDKPDLIIPMTK